MVILQNFVAFLQNLNLILAECEKIDQFHSVLKIDQSNLALGITILTETALPQEPIPPNIRGFLRILVAHTKFSQSTIK